VISLDGSRGEATSCTQHTDTVDMGVKWQLDVYKF